MKTLALLLAAASAVTLAAPATAQTGGVPAPLVDHHQHLLSPEGKAATSPAPLPAVGLPDDVAAVLRAQEAGWNDKGALAGLFTEDAVISGPVSPGWVTGRAEVARVLSERFARPYQMRPASYAGGGESARVAGYYTRGEGGETRYVGYFYVDLVKAGGAWKMTGQAAAFPGPKFEPVVDAAVLVPMLDAAGIRRAVILSDAYYFADTPEPVPGEFEKVRAENDWTAREIARYPDRLIGVCGLNPMRDYAEAEMQRCVRQLGFKAVKLHFDTAKLDVTNAAHVEKTARLFAAANKARVPIIVHLQQGTGYGRAQAEVIVSRLLAAAPDVPVQICHLWGGGGFTQGASDALAVYAEAVERKDPRLRNVYFDVAQIAMVVPTDDALDTLAKRMRQIGMDRMLYGSDGPEYNGVPPRQHWTEFKARMPLTEAELRTIATNIAPYLRD